MQISVARIDLVPGILVSFIAVGNSSSVNPLSSGRVVFSPVWAFWLHCLGLLKTDGIDDAYNLFASMRIYAGDNAENIH